MARQQRDGRIKRWTQKGENFLLRISHASPGQQRRSDSAVQLTVFPPIRKVELVVAIYHAFGWLVMDVFAMSPTSASEGRLQQQSLFVLWLSSGRKINKKTPRHCG